MSVYFLTLIEWRICELSLILSIITCICLQKPKLSCNADLKHFLMNHMPILKEHFNPTFWCYGAIGQTLMRTLIKSHLKIDYRKYENIYYHSSFALEWSQRKVHIQSNNNVLVMTVEMSVCYREFFSLPDGGHVALDWMDNDSNQKYKENKTRPIVLLMPGLIG